MSTRSLVGGLTDSGTYVVYVHFDGYPEERLPVLDAIIKRDGAAKALATILMARQGGWSSLDPDITSTPTPASAAAVQMLGSRGRVVDGYGVMYTDAPDVTPQRFPEEWDDTSWAEYVYLIPEVGPLVWAQCLHGSVPDDWVWHRHEVGQPV